MLSYIHSKKKIRLKEKADLVLILIVLALSFFWMNLRFKEIDKHLSNIERNIDFIKKVYETGER